MERPMRPGKSTKTEMAHDRRPPRALNIRGGLVVPVLISLALLRSGAGLTAEIPDRSSAVRRPAIAVADFAGPTDSMRSLITATFTADLATSEALHLIERGQIKRAIAELKMSLTDTVDASMAPRLGHLIAANKVVVGSFSEADGLIRISARLVDVETGAIEGGSAAAVEGSIAGSDADVYALVHQLANRFHRRLTGQWLPAASLAGTQQRTPCLAGACRSHTASAARRCRDWHADDDRPGRTGDLLPR